MNIFLKKLNPKKDISNDYLKWMNDFEITKYTEQKYKKHTIKDIKKFVNEKNKSNNEFLYGIFLKKKHIGNIKLGPINFIHKFAEISYFIGEKELWCKGYATNAIKLIIKIAKRKDLKKLRAVFYRQDIGSENVLINNYFKKEGVFKSEVQFQNKRSDHIFYGKII